MVAQNLIGFGIGKKKQREKTQMQQTEQKNTVELKPSPLRCSYVLDSFIYLQTNCGIVLTFS